MRLCSSLDKFFLNDQQVFHHDDDDDADNVRSWEIFYELGKDSLISL